MTWAADRRALREGVKMISSFGTRPDLMFCRNAINRGSENVH